MNINGSEPDGRTALMVAAMFNRTESFELLLVHGADIHACDKALQQKRPPE